MAVVVRVKVVTDDKQFKDLVANMKKALKDVETTGDKAGRSVSRSGKKAGEGWSEGSKSLSGFVRQFRALATLGGSVAVLRAAGRTITEFATVADRTRISLVALNQVGKGVGAGQRDIQRAMNAVMADGLVPMNVALQNLQDLMRAGLGVEESVILMQRLKDLAAINRSVHIDFQSAVLNLTQAFKTEQSRLGDLSGLTENFATNIIPTGIRVMNEMGIAVTKESIALDDNMRAQVKYHGILKLTQELAGGATVMTEGATGAIAEQEKAWLDLKIAIGEELDPVVSNWNKMLTSIFNTTREGILRQRRIISEFDKMASHIAQQEVRRQREITRAIEEGNTARANMLRRAGFGAHITPRGTIAPGMVFIPGVGTVSVRTEDIARARELLEIFTPPIDVPAGPAGGDFEARFDPMRAPHRAAELQRQRALEQQRRLDRLFASIAEEERVAPRFDTARMGEIVSEYKKAAKETREAFEFPLPGFLKPGQEHTAIRDAHLGVGRLVTVTREELESAGEELKKFYKELGEDIDSAASSQERLAAFIAAPVTDIAFIVAGLEEVESLGEAIVDVFKGVAAQLAAVAIQAAILAAVSGGTTTFGGAFRGILGFSQGGVVPPNQRPRYYANGGFESRGSDTVPAMLTPGEGILTREATRNLGGAAAISALNRSGGRSMGGVNINIGGGTFVGPGGAREFAANLHAEMLDLIRTNDYEGLVA